MAREEGEPLVVSGVGLVCATGHNAPMAFTSVKAGLARIGQSPELFIRDARQRRLGVTCAAAEGVTDGHRRFLRLYRLAVRAFVEAVAHAKLSEAQLKDAAAFIALAEAERPGLDERAHTHLMPRIGQAMEVAGLSARVFAAGHAGAYLALEQAALAVRSGACERAIVGGADTWLDELSLQWLYDSERLKVEGRAKGFVPGEAAAFLVIERAGTAAARQAGCYARLDGIATDFDAHGLYEKEPCTGDGLTRAIRTALAACPAPPSLVLCDLNGERHRAHEWGLALARCFRGGDAPRALWHPAEGLGDTGAAGGAQNLVLATLALARGNAGPAALAWGSSDDGERGAAVLSSLRAPAHERQPSWA